MLEFGSLTLISNWLVPLKIDTISQKCFNLTMLFSKAVQYLSGCEPIGIVDVALPLFRNVTEDIVLGQLKVILRL